MPMFVPGLRVGVFTVLGMTILAAAPLNAHDNKSLAPHDLWSAWSWEPLVVVSLAASLWLYGRGLRAVWRNAGSGRGIGTWEVTAFVPAGSRSPSH